MRQGGHAEESILNIDEAATDHDEETMASPPSVGFTASKGIFIDCRIAVNRSNPLYLHGQRIRVCCEPKFFGNVVISTYLPFRKRLKRHPSGVQWVAVEEK